jgi:hypothetical protein
MTLKEAAAMLDCREYQSELTLDEEKLLKESGIVALFGRSDDIVELRGAIHDDVEAYRRTTLHFGKDGLIQNLCRDGDCPYFHEAAASAKPIYAMWCEDEYPWSFNAGLGIPCEEFTIFDDGEKYCRGMVFELDSACVASAF